MTNRSVGRKFLSTGHPPDRSWMESGQTRPSWREKGPRSTRDSGMGSMQQPSPVGSGPVDLGQLLRQLMPIEDEASEIGQPMPGAASPDNGVSGNAV